MKFSLIFSLILAGATMVPSGVYARDTDVPRDTSFTFWSTAAKIHKNHPEAVLMLPQLPDGIKAYENVVYEHLKKTKFGPRDLHLDIFRPDNDSVYPAVLMVHGGGWNSGDKSLQVPMAQKIAEHGYVTIPVEYRLSPEAGYPAGLHDLKAAVRWVRKNAKKYGINPDKIAISGCSAGAQLATLVGVTNGSGLHECYNKWVRVPGKVQAIINMDGIATFVSPENIIDSQNFYENKGRLHWNALWLGGNYKDIPERWHEASAVNWVTDESAPICIINSGLPRYSDGCDQLIELYDKKGIYHERHKIDIDVHPFWFFHPWVDQALDYAIGFLDKVFK